jgi:hypothetical protein
LVWFAGGMLPDSGDRCVFSHSPVGDSLILPWFCFGCLDRVTLASCRGDSLWRLDGWSSGSSPVSPSRLHVLPAPAHPSVALVSRLPTTLPFWPHHTPKRLVIPIPLHGISHPKPMHGLSTSPLQDIRVLGSCETRPAPPGHPHKTNPPGCHTSTNPMGPRYAHTVT